MEPLIYTSKGNVPISSLEYHHEWRDSPEITAFREWYTDESGEIVKDSTHVFSRVGVVADIAASLG